MKQLKMLWRCRETAYPDNPWQGFRYRPFSGSEEISRVAPLLPVVASMVTLLMTSWS